MAEEEQKKEKTLREKDPAEWKARKARRQHVRNKARTVAKLRGIKLGRWRGSVAYVKRGTRVASCVVIGAGKAPRGLEVVSLTGPATPLEFMEKN